jgi:hypothetical protein
MVGIVGMFNQKYIILFIDRNRFQFYGGNLTGIVTVEIPQIVLSDLDVLRKDDLYTLIKQCVKQYALLGSQLIMVFSEATYFEKIFPPGDEAQTDSDILKFFDSIPYESIWTKVYQTDKGKRAVAVNRALYEALHQGFMLQGLVTKALLPACVLGQLSRKRILDKPLADYILNTVDVLTKQSLLDAQEIETSGLQGGTQSAANPKKATLPLLLGAFGVLIVILAIAAITQLR